MKQEVKDKIEEESTKHSTSIGLYGVLTEGVKYLSFKMGAEFGYNLAQEEYAAQSKGMRWGSEDKPDLAHEALERNYPEREGAFGSTWTDGYMQCMRDIENGDLKSQSTQEGGTVGELFEQLNPQDGLLPEWAKEVAIKYASQVSATDKKRISELEKEVLDLKEINKLLSDGITKKIRNEALSKYTEWKEDFCKRKNICPVCVTGGYECTSDHK